MSKIKYVLISITALIFLLFLIPEKYLEIETRYLLSNTGPVSQIYEAPNKPSPLCIQSTNPASPLILSLNYLEEIDFDKISIYFPGNTVNVTSYAPVDFLIAHKTNDSEWWQLLDKIEGNSNSSYQKVFESTQKASSLQIQITKPFSTDTGIVCFSDLKLYKLQKSNIIQRFSNFMGLNHRKLPFYLAYYLIFLSFLFIPGYTTLTFIKSKEIDNDLKIILSPIISMGTLMTLSILYLLTGITLLLDLYLFFFAGSLVLFIKNKGFKDLVSSKEVFITILVSILIVFCVLAKRDYMFNLQYIGTHLDNLKNIPMEGYTGYFVDNFFPWGISRLYLHRSPISSPQAQSYLLGTTIFERTPGFPLMITPIIRMFGESHQVYQRFLETLTGIYFGSIYVLAKKLFSKKTALISTILILLNVQLLYIDFNAELFYKYVATYPTLIALLLFNTDIKKKDLLIGILLGLSFLIHPSTLIVSATFGCVYLLKYKISKDFVKKALPTALIVGTLLSMWVLAPKLIKLEEFSEKKTRFYFNQAQNFDKNIVKAKVSNFIALFYPNPYLKDEDSTFEPLSRDHRFQVLRYSLIFNLTPLLFVTASYYMFKNLKKDLTIISFIYLPLVIYWAIYLNKINQDYNYGGSYFLLYPFVIPIFLMYVVEKVLKIKNMLFRKVVITSYIVFMSLNLYIISGIFRKDLIFPSPIPLFLTFCITLVFLGLSGTLIFALDKSD